MSVYGSWVRDGRMPTPAQRARYHARVRRDLAFYRACLARLDPHGELYCGTERVVRTLATLDEYLARPPVDAALIAQTGEGQTATIDVRRGLG